MVVPCRLRATGPLEGGGIEGTDVESPRSMKRVLARIAVLLAALPIASGCQSSSTPCQGFCPSNAIVVGPSGTQTSPTFKVTLGGSACGPADLSCTGDGTCEIVPHAAGTCHIVVAVDGGATITRDITVVDYGSSCCGGLSPQQSFVDTSAALPDGGVD
jgi:hypothetical protein